MFVGRTHRIVAQHRRLFAEIAKVLALHRHDPVIRIALLFRVLAIITNRD